MQGFKDWMGYFTSFLSPDPSIVCTLRSKLAPKGVGYGLGLKPGTFSCGGDVGRLKLGGRLGGVTAGLGGAALLH